MKIFNKQLIINNRITGTGWLPPRPDLRDYSEDHESIRRILASPPPPISQSPSQEMEKGRKGEREKVDLRQFCSPVEDQGPIGSCTAHAAAGIVEYYERKAFGKHLEASRLFLYKTTRNLMQTTGDTGSWIRCTMGSLVLCGLPDEKYWPYDVAKFDNEPPAFVYSVANNYQAVKYFRHDVVARGSGLRAQGKPSETLSSREIACSERRTQGTGKSQESSGQKAQSSVESQEHSGARASSSESISEGKRLNKSLSENKPSALPCAPDSKENVLLSVKTYLEAGLPSMFGFWGFGSFEKSDVKGGIPYPAEGEAAQWGHAVAAFGYDDKKKIKNLVNNKTTTGALLIRNSWGADWGEEGYGWLPYEYVLNGLAEDFWSMLSMEWVETGQFGV